MMYMEMQHFSSLESAVKSIYGNDTNVIKKEYVGGGDINEAYKLTLSDGTCLFMKFNAGKSEAFFQAEALGLSAIAKTETIGTPKILCTGIEKNGAFLLLEFIEGKSRIPDYWETLGRQLAAMHKTDTTEFVAACGYGIISPDIIPRECASAGGTISACGYGTILPDNLPRECASAEGSVSVSRYGFIQDNFIGERKQQNTVCESWISFFREQRLKPQLQAAAGYFTLKEQDELDKLLDKLEDILIEPEYPSLLHGDLWGGNVITGNDGKAWLIDPAVYVGCAEADLAMTELFGGFPRAFYETYRKAAPLQQGYEHRRDLYNLYHLLNHLNMFGGSYLTAVKRVIEKYRKYS